jgi:polyribonucleotide nucleotidyltransferase
VVGEAWLGQDWFPLTVVTPDLRRKAGGFFSAKGAVRKRSDLAPHRPPDPAAVPGWLPERSAGRRQVLSLNPKWIPTFRHAGGFRRADPLGHPFNGPIGACRVGYVDGRYIINPTQTQLKTSQLNLVVCAGTGQGVLMVESRRSSPKTSCSVPSPSVTSRCG